MGFLDCRVDFKVFVMCGELWAGLKKACAILRPSSVCWLPPSKCTILIYDACGAEIVVSSLSRYGVEILPVRGETINAWCLLQAILKPDFWNGAARQTYVDVFISTVSPKIILTLIDNNPDFYRISNRFSNIKTIFLQNGTRGEVCDVFGRLQQSDLYYVDYMLVHGAAIGRYYQKFVSGDAVTIGSFKNNAVEKRIGDTDGSVLFISQYQEKPKSNEPLWIEPDGSPVFWDQFYSIEVYVLDFLSRWCSENSRNLRICARGTEKDGPEYRYYASHVHDGCAWEFITRDGGYSSYVEIDKAEIVVFIDSTLGYEAIARGKKTAGFSSRMISKNKKAFEFGWPCGLPRNGPFWTNDVDDKQFRRIMDYLNNVSDEDWKSECKKYASELIDFDAGNTRFMALLDTILQK